MSITMKSTKKELMSEIERLNAQIEAFETRRTNEKTASAETEEMRKALQSAAFEKENKRRLAAMDYAQKHAGVSARYNRNTKAVEARRSSLKPWTVVHQYQS